MSVTPHRQPRSAIGQDEPAVAPKGPADPLANLPEYVVFRVLSFVDLHALVQCRRVCKGWRDVLDGNRANVEVWGAAYRRLAGFDDETPLDTPASKSWKSECRALCKTPVEVLSQFTHTHTILLLPFLCLSFTFHCLTRRGEKDPIAQGFCRKGITVAGENFMVLSTAKERIVAMLGKRVLLISKSKKAMVLFLVDETTVMGASGKVGLDVFRFIENLKSIGY